MYISVAEHCHIKSCRPAGIILASCDPALVFIYVVLAPYSSLCNACFYWSAALLPKRVFIGPRCQSCNLILSPLKLSPHCPCTLCVYYSFRLSVCLSVCLSVNYLVRLGVVAGSLCSSPCLFVCLRGTS